MTWDQDSFDWWNAHRPVSVAPGTMDNIANPYDALHAWLATQPKPPPTEIDLMIEGLRALSHEDLLTAMRPLLERSAELREIREHLAAVFRFSRDAAAE